MMIIQYMRKRSKLAKRLLFVLLSCSLSTAASHPAIVEVTRILSLRVTAEGENLQYCVKYAIKEKTGILGYLTLPFDSQIQFHATDQNHKIIFQARDINFIRSPQFPPPYYDDPTNYLIINTSTTIESCFLGKFDDYGEETYITYAQFVPWLKRDNQFPLNIKAQIMESPIIARPLYNDEIITSNACTISKRNRTVLCQ